MEKYDKNGNLKKEYYNESNGLWYQYKKGLYTELLMTGTLNKHLAEIDKTANVRVNTIICEMAKKEDTPLYYDRKMNQLEWVSLMNNYKHCAEEIIFAELIYN